MTTPTPPPLWLVGRTEINRALKRQVYDVAIPADANSVTRIGIQVKEAVKDALRQLP